MSHAALVILSLVSIAAGVAGLGVIAFGLPKDTYNRLKDKKEDDKDTKRSQGHDW